MSGPPLTDWTYYGNDVWLPEPVGPQHFPRPHAMTAKVVVPADGPNGVILCAGAFSAGWSLYVKDGKPAFWHTFLELADVSIASKTKIPGAK